MIMEHTPDYTPEPNHTEKQTQPATPESSFELDWLAEFMPTDDAPQNPSFITPTTPSVEQPAAQYDAVTQIPSLAESGLPSRPLDTLQVPSADVITASEEEISSIDENASALVKAMDLQARLARQKALEEQASMEAKARQNLEVMMDAYRVKADERPEYYRSAVLNRYETDRRVREKAEIEAQNRDRIARGEPLLAQPKYGVTRDYAAYGKNRWGVAALEGVAMVTGMNEDKSLNPVKRREIRMALRAARVASKNLGISMAKESLERDPRKKIDKNDEHRGGRRYGGLAIDPATSKSRLRDGDPNLKNKSRQHRKIIKQGEKRHRKLAQKHQNQVHYLKNQGEKFVKRRNIKQRVENTKQRIANALKSRA